jgi:hypothetical protein
MPTNRQPSRVTLVTPVYRPQLSAAEQVSLECALTVLAPHDHHLIAPHGLDVTAYGDIFRRHGKPLRVEWFEADCFRDVAAYCCLLNSAHFYRRFARYEFMLVYQLDCYVFRDELLDWCDKGYDYIGAPWFKGFDQAREDAAFVGVGNGGLSLRRIPAALRALRRYQVARLWYRTFGRLYRTYDPQEWNQHLCHNEDCFWGLALGPRVPGFRIPSAEAAIPFAFEVNPRRLYRLNGERLPFGCHAWRRYDPEFWAQFIPAARPDVVPQVARETAGDHLHPYARAGG